MSSLPGQSTGGLSWPVKASFRRYVESAADGAVGAAHGATMSEDGFLFPWEDEPTPGGSELCFAGEIRFRAHGGFLMVALSNPRLEAGATPDCARLTIEYPWRSDTPQPRLAIADVRLNSSGDGSTAQRSASVRLTADGAELLGGVYAVGTELDPLVVHPVPSGLPNSTSRQLR